MQPAYLVGMHTLALYFLCIFILLFLHFFVFQQNVCTDQWFKNNIFKSSLKVDLTLYFLYISII